ncbi:MAG: HAD-IA family hydrolase [Nitrospirae bacterium]|nr:HAD-IA family hydrolase [Nitrospirota bacterium]
MVIVTHSADWRRAGTVLLDMDGVLLDLYFDDDFWMEHLPARYAAVHDLDRVSARDMLLAWYREQEGTLNWYDVDYWSHRVGFDVTHLKVRQAGRIALHPLVPEFLTTLGNTGRRRVLVTNAHPKAMRLKLAASGLGKYLDGTVSAFDIGMGKEEPGFWERLHRVVDYRPERAVLIEDSLPNLGTAAAYGMGGLIQVTQPNSHQPPRPAGPYAAVAGVGDLIPGVLLAPPEGG